MKKEEIDIRYFSGSFDSHPTHRLPFHSAPVQLKQHQKWNTFREWESERSRFNPAHFGIIIMILHSSCKRILAEVKQQPKNSDRPFRLKWFFPETVYPYIYMRVHVRLKRTSKMESWEINFLSTRRMNFSTLIAISYYSYTKCVKCTPCSFLAEL